MVHANDALYPATETCWGQDSLERERLERVLSGVRWSVQERDNVLHTSISISDPFLSGDIITPQSRSHATTCGFFGVRNLQDTAGE